MSEVYNFKRLSEVDVQEAPTDATTVLAVEDGLVKQIPAGKFGGGSGGGGAGNFIVNVAIDESMSATGADKTFAEIVAALQGGCIPSAYIAMGDVIMVLPFTNGAIAEALVFSLFVPMSGILSLTCLADDTWELDMVSLGG